MNLIENLIEEINELAKKSNLSEDELEGLFLANEDCGMTIEESCKDIIKMFESGEIERMKEILTDEVRNSLELMLYKERSKIKSEGKLKIKKAS